MFGKLVTLAAEWIVRSRPAAPATPAPATPAPAQPFFEHVAAQVAPPAPPPPVRPPAKPAAPVAVAKTPAAPAPVPVPAPAEEQARRGRPVSEALTRTMKLLSANPSITPAQVAKKLNVSSSYARTLLRRAKMRSATEPAALELVAAAEPTVAPPEPEVQLEVPTPARKEGAVAEADALAAVLSRLEAAESEIQDLRTTRSATRVGWNRSRRTDVIQRSTKGETPQQIAAELGLPSGEVNFILKIHRLMLASR